MILNWHLEILVKEKIVDTVHLHAPNHQILISFSLSDNRRNNRGIQSIISIQMYPAKGARQRELRRRMTQMVMFDAYYESPSFSSCLSVLVRPMIRFIFSLSVLCLCFLSFAQKCESIKPKEEFNREKELHLLPFDVDIR